MTRPYSYQKWQTARVWPGGGWGEALAQVRKDQHLTQRDIAEYVGVSLATLRKWEDGLALPERSLWPKLEEAMGMPVPDPRVPDHTPAERELIDTMLLMIDELRLLGERIAKAPVLGMTMPPKVEDSKMLDVNRAASYLGVSTSFIRNLVAQRSLVHYKLGGRVMFRREDIDQFVDQNKRELPDFVPWQLQGRRGKSPRTSARTTTKPARSVRSTPPKMSKQEIAEKRWLIAELAERWWGIDSATALLEMAEIAFTEDAAGQSTFRYGDLVSWMENHKAEFGQWLEEFDPSLKRRVDANHGAGETADSP
jgi:excisionase family DNA binding protein